MSLISHLIVKEWNRFFIAALSILLMLITVANLISGFLRANVSAYEVLLNFLLELPQFLTQILPVSCMVASLFSTNKLKNRNELTAIFASGYSRKRFIYNILQASLIVAFMQFFISAYIGPFAKEHRHQLLGTGKHKFRNLQSKGLKASTLGSGKQWFKSHNYYFSFDAYDKQKNILRNPTLFIFDKNYKLASKFSAKSSFYKNHQWHFREGLSYLFLNAKNFPSITSFKLKKVPLKETPEDFQELEADITTLNIAGLYNYILKLKKSGINTNEYSILFYNKFSAAFICMLFALVGALPVFNPNRKNSTFGKSILFIFVFTILYWLVHSFMANLGINSKIPPLVASFSIPILFMIFLIYKFYRNRKIK